jgi:starvation-inducible DNA-binding protein
VTTIETLPPAPRRATPGDVLQGALIDLIDLAMAAKQAHWNIYGPGFRSLHLHLDEIASQVRDLADEIAERAVTLGTSPDGRPASVAAHSSDAFPAGRITVDVAVAALSSRFASLIKRMRQRIHDTGDADPITQDLLIGTTAVLEKQHWMLRATTDS